MARELANRAGVSVHHRRVLLVVPPGDLKGAFMTRFPSTASATSTSEPTSDRSIDPQLRVRILIETAMQAAQFSDANAELIARELAAELCQQQASLSDVRVAVQELYQGDRPGADAYLLYLERHGFPAPPANPPPPPAAEQAISQQQQAISSYEQNAYGQLAVSPEEKTVGLYSGNLIAELAANSAYSALILGERRSGTSAILRGIAYDRIERSGQTILDILDLHNGEWGGLEDIRLEDGSQIVSYQTLTSSSDIELIAQKLNRIAAEVKRRQRQQRSTALSLSAAPSPPYLFLIDGLSEIHGVLPGWSADRRSKEASFAQAANSLRVILAHGPAVGLSCVATARDHSSCLCDSNALAETRLLCLGRVSPGRNGGYRAIDRAIEDKTLLPSSHERHRWREVMTAVKQLAHPVVFTPNGIPRLGSLGNFGGYLSADLLTHYQQALEVQR